MSRFGVGRLQFRLILAFALVLLIPTLLISVYALNAETNAVIEKGKAKEISALQPLGSQISAAFDRRLAGIQFLANAPYLQGYLKVATSKDSAAIGKALSGVPEAIAAYIAASGIYDSVRLLDPSGQELIRVSVTNNKTAIADSANLTKDPTPDYFAKTIGLPVGQIHASPLRLLKENGFPKIPFTPVIDLSAPVFSADHQLVGVMSAAFLAEPILALTQAQVINQGVYLIDSDGSYLAAPIANQLYARDLNNGAFFLKLNPLEGQQFLTNSVSIFGTKDRPNLLQTSIHVSPTLLKDIQWTLYATKTTDSILEEVRATQLGLFGLALLSLLAAFVVALIVTRGITRPVNQLATAAEQISAGKLDTLIPVVRRRDEIGDLATAFGKMSSDLQTLYGTMEDRVAARTSELEIVARVSAAATTITDPDVLLKTVAELTKSSFKLYHAHVYLLGDDGRTLKLAAGAGEAGDKMRAAGHSIPFNREHSLVARCARSRRGVIVADVAKEPDFLANPLLPDTRSEMAVPIVINDELIGVLDTQSTRVGTFTQDNIKVMTTLADQLAVAIENANAFDRRRQLLVQAETRLNNLQASSQIAEYIRIGGDLDGMLENVLRSMLDVFGGDTAVISNFDADLQQWSGVAGAGGPVTSALAKTFIDPAAAYPHGVAVIEGGDVVAVADVATYPNFPLVYIETLGLKSVMVLPLRTNPGGDQVTGVAFINYSTRPHHFSAEEIDLARSLANQISAGIGRRVAESETARRALELETVAQVSAAATTLRDVTELLQTVANLTKDRFNLYHAHIYLLDGDTGRLRLAAGSGEVGRAMVESGHSIPLSRERSIVARAARLGQSLYVADVIQEASFLPNPLLPDTRSELAVPLIVADIVLGVLDLQSEKVGRFTDTDLQVMTTLGDQTAIALENARAFAATQDARRESELLYEAGKSINAATTFSDLAQAAASVDIDATMISLTMYENFDLSTARWFERSTANTASTAPMRFYLDQFPMVRQQPEFSMVEDVNDPAQLDPVTAASLKNLGFGAFLAVALKRESRIMGSLTIFHAMAHHFTAQDKRLADGLSSLLSSALERLRLSYDSEAARIETDILYKIGAVISTTTNEHELIESLAGYLLSDGESTLNLSLWENRDFDTATSLSFVATWGAYQDAPLAGVTIPTSADPARLSWLQRHHINYIDDIHSDPSLPAETVATLDALKIGSLIFAPLTVGERWLGNLGILDSQARTHSAREVRILESVAGQVTTAIERMWLTRQMEQRARDMTTVAAISAATTKVLDLQELLQDVVNLTKDRFGLYHAHIYLLDAEHEVLTLAAGAGEAGRVMKANHHRIPLYNPISLVARAARTHEGVVINDVTQAADFLPNPLLPKTRSEMAIPMVIGDRLVGVLDVQSDVIGRFTQDDVQIETALADQIAVAVQNAQLYQGEVETARQLREIDRLKSEFLASMSHELRTPLNSIIGYSEVLADGIDGDLPDEAIEDVNAIHDSGNHLLSLINDILDLAKIEAGRMELELQPLPLGEVMIEIDRITRSLIKEKPVQLVFNMPDDLPLLSADHVRLRQILNNLVSNAIKFTDRGDIHVTARLTDDQKSIQVAVQDSGIGIAPEHQKLVFEQFRQVDSGSTRKAGGTGLGLPITQHLVRMHGGEIWLTSTVGAGSTFYFTIPVVPVAVVD